MVTYDKRLLAKEKSHETTRTTSEKGKDSELPNLWRKQSSSALGSPTGHSCALGPLRGSTAQLRELHTHNWPLPCSSSFHTGHFHGKEESEGSGRPEAIWMNRRALRYTQLVTYDKSLSATEKCHETTRTTSERWNGSELPKLWQKLCNSGQLTCKIGVYTGRATAPEASHCQM